MKFKKSCLNGFILIVISFFFSVNILQAQDQPSNAEILLFKFISDGNKPKVDSLLSAGASPNAIYFKQISAASFAAYMGKADILRALIEKGANLELVAEYSMIKATPLGFAVLGSSTACVKILLSNGALTNGSVSNQGFGNATSTYNWLMHAVKVNDLESAAALISAGAPTEYIADFYMDFKYNGKTPLIYAAELGHADMVKLLLDKGANINAMGKDWQGNAVNSPLMTAAEFGHEGIVSELVARGASVTRADAFGMTPLLSAAKQSRVNTSKVLLDNGADINEVNTNSLNALQVSINIHRIGAQIAMSNRSASIDKTYQYDALLSSAKSGWELTDTTGNLTHVDIQYLEREIRIIQLGELEPVMLNELSELSRYKYQNLLYTRFLIEQGIDIDYRAQGKSAANMAQEFRLDEALGALLNAGADIANIPAPALLQHAIKSGDLQRFTSYYNSSGQVSDSLKCELLGSATIAAHTGIMDFLLARGAGVNCSNPFGQTALHLAAYTGNEETVGLLLSKNADRSKADSKGVLPVMIAQYMDRKEIITDLATGNQTGVPPVHMGYSLANIENKYFQIENPAIAGMINLYQHYVYSNALDKGISTKDPLISWLNQNVEDSLKWKYASALFSQGFLETQTGTGALATFKANHAYKTWDGFKLKLTGSYKTGANGTVNFSAEGTNKFTKVEDKNDTHDRSSSIAFHLQEFNAEWTPFVPEYFAGMGVFIGACGGWDNHCLVVVNGDCYSFSDADARRAEVSYSISGSYKIPGIQTVNGAYAAYPRVEVWNRENAVPLEVKQGGNTFSLDANERRTFTRQLGELEIRPSWSASTRASGGDCNNNTKQAAFQVKFPSTFDVNLRGQQTHLNARLKSYSDIYLLKRTLLEGADTLSSIDLYGLSSTILLKSEIARNTYEDIVRAELVGIVNFLENTNFTNINDALILLAQSEQFTVEDIRFRIQQLLAIDQVDEMLAGKLRVIDSELDNLSLSEARSKILGYKQSYLQVVNKKIKKYNLLLLEYAMFIPNESLIQQLSIDRIPLIDNYLNEYSRYRFNL